MLLTSGGHRYVATDTDEESLNELRARLEYRPDVEAGFFDFSRQEEVAEFERSADTVVCLNVLEHVAEDRAALANIRRCLRPRGIAIVLVPQGPELFGSIDEVLQHKRRYTKDELVEKMAGAGLRVERVLEFNRATRPGWYFNSRVLRRKTISSVQLGVFDLLVPVWRKVDARLPWPANSLIAIGVADE
jgi:SAM-dependent methyltransferase